LKSRNKRTVLFLLLATILFSSYAPSWKKLSTIDIQVKDLELDHLGNVYVVSKTNQLYKFNENGILLSTLNYAYLGNITHIDCSNPLELYLFYKELNAIVFLDNNLAYRGRMNLSDFGILQAAAAGRAYDNGVWVFDQGDMQLKKLERDGTIMQQSGNSLQFVDQQKLSPEDIKDNGNRVFVCDTSSGILMFDVFANYIKTFTKVSSLSYMVNDKELTYLEKDKLIKIKILGSTRDTLNLPVTGIIQAKLGKDKVYLSDSNQLHIYSFD